MADKVRSVDTETKPPAPGALTPEEKSKFYELFESLSKTQDPKERKRIKEELAQLTYGC